LAAANGEDEVSAENKARFVSVALPHLDDAYILARWVTGDSDGAHNVVQDAYTRTYSAADRFSDRNARAWVLTLVRHTAYIWLQMNRPTAHTTVKDFEAAETLQVPPGSIGPGVEIMEVDGIDVSRLEAAIADLPILLRETLILKDVLGLHYREIAAITGVPIGMVLSRLARARGRLMTKVRRRDNDAGLGSW